MWRVELLKAGPKHDFPQGFFPRKVYYKKNAQQLKEDIERKGGEASIWREK